VTPDPALDDIRWLIGAEAAQLLDQLSGNPGSLVAVAPGLKRRFSDARVHLLLQQVELRCKGAAKFPHAERMFFLAQALQQATDIHVARYKASRFPPRERVADLCCGIGGDSMALAERGPITAVDRDQVTVLFAEANLRVAEVSGEENGLNEFRVEDVAAFFVESFAAWHLDPDRRARGRRTIQLADYAPGLDTIVRLLAEREDGAIKLAPATNVPESWQETAELEWIGRDRQCRQQVAWFGGLARSPGFRRATVLRSRPDGCPTVATLVGNPGIRSAVDEQIGRFVLEPDAAVLAADLAGALAEQYGLAALHPDVPYFTANERIDDPLVPCFEVTEVLPFDRKRLRKLFHERGVGRLEIKTRGVEEPPERIRRDLRLSGEAEATLLVARLGRRVKAIVASRV
jgi:SAM-dependent methyltransferase